MCVEALEFTSFTSHPFIIVLICDSFSLFFFLRCFYPRRLAKLYRYNETNVNEQIKQTWCMHTRHDLELDLKLKMNLRVCVYFLNRYWLPVSHSSKSNRFTLSFEFDIIHLVKISYDTFWKFSLLLDTKTL